MSHIVSIKTRVTDAAVLAVACRRLGISEPELGTAKLYSGSANGLLIQLPGWHYPAVVNVAAGTIAFDNFGGAWGAQAELDRLLQAYACEKARIEARRAGHTVTEQPQADGSIKLTI